MFLSPRLTDLGGDGMARECGRNAQEMESYRDIRAISRLREHQACVMINEGLKVPVAVRLIALRDCNFAPEWGSFAWVCSHTATFMQQVARTIEFGADLPWKKQILLANWNYRKRVEA